LGLHSYPSIELLWTFPWVSSQVQRVDKVLKGAKPGELPVETVTRYELIVNLKTAKQIGVTIPPEVLKRANQVIQPQITPRPLGSENRPHEGLGA
jgi:putative ABC transport system substrate-binding protein